jgi:hypothetical protein
VLPRNAAALLIDQRCTIAQVELAGDDEDGTGENSD